METYACVCVSYILLQYRVIKKRSFVLHNTLYTSANKDEDFLKVNKLRFNNYNK